jgi:hypothetical protein
MKSCSTSAFSTARQPTGQHRPIGRGQKDLARVKTVLREKTGEVSGREANMEKWRRGVRKIRESAL